MGLPLRGQDFWTPTFTPKNDDNKKTQTNPKKYPQNYVFFAFNLENLFTLTLSVAYVTNISSAPICRLLRNPFFLIFTLYSLVLIFTLYSLVNENLNPTEVCTGLTLCP